MAAPLPLSRFLTVEAVADLLSVCKQTVIAEIKRGSLRAMWLGHGYRIRVADFEDWAARRIEATSAAAAVPAVAEPEMVPLPPYRSGRKAKAGRATA